MLNSSLGCAWYAKQGSFFSTTNVSNDALTVHFRTSLIVSTHLFYTRGLRAVHSVLIHAIPACLELQTIAQAASLALSSQLLTQKSRQESVVLRHQTNLPSY